jgi:hypothetical protein
MLAAQIGQSRWSPSGVRDAGMWLIVDLRDDPQIDTRSLIPVAVEYREQLQKGYGEARQDIASVESATRV